MAVAAASRSPIGIDLETVTDREASFEAVAFDDEERRLLAGVNGRTHEEWLARAWTAKEAAGKALGGGLADGPGTVRVRGIQESGNSVTFACEVGPNGARAVPSDGLSVRSVRDGEFVIALAVRGVPAHV
jgi:phosphopantetheinyl transferase